MFFLFFLWWKTKKFAKTIPWPILPGDKYATVSNSMSNKSSDTTWLQCNILTKIKYLPDIHFPMQICFLIRQPPHWKFKQVLLSLPFKKPGLSCPNFQTSDQFQTSILSDKLLNLFSQFSNRKMLPGILQLFVNSTKHFLCILIS